VVHDTIVIDLSNGFSSSVLWLIRWRARWQPCETVQPYPKLPTFSSAFPRRHPRCHSTSSTSDTSIKKMQELKYWSVNCGQRSPMKYRTSAPSPGSPFS
jgi:hypothetical protein